MPKNKKKESKKEPKKIVKSKPKKTLVPKKVPQKKTLTPQELEKQQFTKEHKPWVGILRMEVDPENISDGLFELDWNATFITKLVKAGYQGKTDQDLVDQWFHSICENVVSGHYENAIADPEIRKIIQKVQIDKDRTEHS